MHKTSLWNERPEGVVGAVSMPLRLTRRLFQSGFASTYQRAAAKLRVAWAEWRYGLKTETFIPWDRLTDDPCSVDYEPTTYSAIRHVLNQVAAPEQHVLLDYGCGMGRVLAMAIRHGFPKAVGVELSDKLCAAAQANLKRSLHEQSKRVDVFCENAREWSTPDDVTVIYLFNPFRGRVLEETLDRIRESLVRRPRKLTVLYLQPLADENTLMRRPWLTLKREETLEGIRFCVFEH